MPEPIIRAFGILKKCAAKVVFSFYVLNFTNIGSGGKPGCFINKFIFIGKFSQLFEDLELGS